MLAVDNEYVEAYLALGAAYDEQGNQSAAGETYVRLFKIAPSTPNLASRLSPAQLTNLVSHFRLRLILDPTNAHKHYYYLGYVLYWQGHYQGAIENYDKSISFRPNEGSGQLFRNRLRRPALRLRGLALSKLGKHRQAIDSIEQAMGLSPTDVEHYSLGEVLVNQGQDLEGGIASYDRAIEINENYALAYNARGQVRMRLEDWEGARRDFMSAINSDEGYAEPHNNLGQLYQLSGSFDQPIYAYNRALSISDHNYPNASQNLASAQAQLKNWLASQEYQGPTGGDDEIWVSDDDISVLKRSVVRIVPNNGGTPGAGWIIKQENNSVWVVTNHHVIPEGGTVDVQFFSILPTGRDYLKLPASLIQSSENPDLALLRIDNAPGKIQILKLTPESLEYGSRVKIVGHPYTNDEWSIVDGHASRNNSQNDHHRVHDPYHLQIDANVGTGNSGGPVINDQNQVVGVMHSSSGVINAGDVNATGGFAAAYSVSALRNTLTSWGIEVP